MTAREREKHAASMRSRPRARQVLALKAYTAARWAVQREQGDAGRRLKPTDGLGMRIAAKAAGVE